MTLTVKKRITLVITAVISFIIIFSFINPAGAVSESEKRLFDDAGVFNEEEYENLNALLLETEEVTGFYVSLVAADDVGYDKSDAGVVDYADLYYEKYFGIDTDGIIFIINNDTYYDYISTSGICIRYFTDARIDSVHQSIKQYLVNEDYAGAVKKYCERAEYYYGQGIPSNQHNIYGDGTVSYAYEDERSAEENALLGAAGGLIISLIIVIVTAVSVKNRYGIKPAKNAVDYLNRSSVRYSQKSDTFIRRYIRKRRIDTENHSGGGGGGSGSSVHTSSGGGSHGGGGSHR